MHFYLEGRTLPNGPFFRAPEEYETIEAALEAARAKMSCGNAVWIKDERDALVLSLQEARQWIERRFGPSIG